MGSLTSLLFAAGGLGAAVTLIHPVKGESFRDAFRVGIMTSGLSFVIWGSAMVFFK